MVRNLLPLGVADNRPRVLAPALLLFGIMVAHALLETARGLPRTISRFHSRAGTAPRETADLDELATLAENLVEATLRAGSILAIEGERLHDIHLIIDGTVMAASRDVDPVEHRR